jgi:glycosyltransferase involved in cell wall biosynthesis
MKVLMCITGLNRGGAEKNFAEICVDTAARGFHFEPVVASLIGGYYLSAIRGRNIPVFVILEPRNPVSICMNILRYVFFLVQNRRRIDVVQAFMPHGGLLAAMSNLILHKPFIYGIRNSQIQDEFRKSWINRSVRNFAHYVSLRMSTMLTCNSSAIQADLASRTSKKVALVLNAVQQPPSEAYKDAKVKAEFFSPGGKYNVVSICNMRYPQKDIITLLRVAGVCRDLRFVLVGGGTGLHFFKQKAEEFGSSNVVFTGSYQNIFPFLSYADLYILLTRFEGFPNSVLEAMISQRPVIMSDIPEVTDVLVSGENCLLVKNGDVQGIAEAILTLRSDSGLRERIVANAYRMASTVFAPANMIASNYSVYAQAKEIAGC